MGKANYVAIASDKKKWKAFWLCLLLGYFGAHQFYVRRYGRGLLYCFTFGLCLFGWFGDLGKILSGKFTDADGMPVRR